MVNNGHDMKEIRFQFSVRTFLVIFFLAIVGTGIVVPFQDFWKEILAGFLVLASLTLIISHDQPLAFFLKYFNPLLAVVVLAICIFAASTSYDNNSLEYTGWFKDPIQTYFLAKGLFCAVAIFLLGKVVEIMSKL